MAAGYCAESAAWFVLIPSEFVDGSVAMLYVSVVAHKAYKMEYGFGLGFAVGVKAETVALAAI